MDIKWDIVLSLPGDVTFLKTMAFVLVFSLAVFLMTLLARYLLGKDSSLKTALTSSLGILMLYAMCMVIIAFSPRDFSGYINQLPMGVFKVTEAGEKVFELTTLRNLDFLKFCEQLLRIFLLAVTINLLANVTPKNLKFLGWVLFRLFMLGCSIFLNYALLKVIDMFAPFLFVKYAPLVLLTILAFSFLLGFVKFLLALVLTVVNPVFGAFYAFFFKSKFGKALSRAIGSTVVIVAVVFSLEHLGYGTLPVNPGALVSYIPFGLSMFILWIITGRAL